MYCGKSVYLLQFQTVLCPALSIIMKWAKELKSQRHYLFKSGEVLDGKTYEGEPKQWLDESSLSKCVKQVLRHIGVAESVNTSNPVQLNL